jgi:hypothetical protein
LKSRLQLNDIFSRQQSDLVVVGSELVLSSETTFLGAIRKQAATKKCASENAHYLSRNKWLLGLA